MGTKVARSLYKIIDLSRHQNTFVLYNQLKSNETLSRDQLTELNWTKLKTFLEYAYKNVPYYNREFQKLGLVPEDINNFEDFLSIPVLTKEKLRNITNDLISRERNLKYTKAKTSGSTGIPLKFLKDNLSFSYSQAAMYRGHSWFNVSIGEKEAMLWGIPVSLKGRIITSSKDIILNRFREKDFNLSSDVLSDFYNRCLHRKPAYLMGYTSMIYQFAKFLEDKAIDGSRLNLKFVKFTSENISPIQRELIENVFKCPVSGEYGAAETGLIAFECFHKNYHLMIDCCYTEIVNPKGNLQSDSAGKLIVTDFHNFKMPLLRYEIGDSATFSQEECPCGLKFPILRDLLGRTTDVVLSTKGVPYHSIVFYYLMKDFAEKNGEIFQFKVHQISTTEIEIKIVKTNKIEEKDLNYFTGKIKEKLGQDMNVRFKYTDSIPREKSGKLRDFTTDIDINLLREKLP